MHLSALLSLVALPFLVNSRPTNQDLPVHIMPGGDNIAGIFANGPEFNGIFVNGGCSPNFGKTVKTVLIFEGYRCRFFREDFCKGRIGGVEGLPFPGGDLYQPARSATCWHG